MTPTTRILVKDLTPRCLTEDAGKLVFNTVLPSLKNGERIELDFEGLTMFASLFFNNSLAPLFRDFDPAFIGSHLEVTNLNEVGRKTFGRSMENAAEFFKLDANAQAEIARIVAAAGEKH